VTRVVSKGVAVLVFCVLLHTVNAAAQGPQALSAAAPTGVLRPLVSGFDPALADSTGTIVVDGEVLRGSFAPGGPDQGPHILTYRIGPPRKISGGSRFSFRVNGWKAIKYVAYGFVDSDGVFWHIKVPHLVQDEWLTEDIVPGSIAFQLCNDWRGYGDKAISSIRLFVRGEPGVDGANAELASVDEIVREDGRSDFLLDIGGQTVKFSHLPEWWGRGLDVSSIRPDIIHALNAYVRSSWPTYRDDADYFMQTGGISLSGLPRVGWAWADSLPTGIAEYSTSRYMWHALNPVSVLVQSFNDTGETRYLYAARSIAESWMDENLNRPPQDDRYTWYDHATAMRTLALLQLWEAGLREHFDARFMARLLEAIWQHGTLLSSEAFYARNQVVRHQNHAVFQDIALFIIGQYVPQLIDSRQWQQVALRRLSEQFQSLIVIEHGYAVYQENSYGYHAAMGMLCHLADVVTRTAALGQRPFAGYRRPLDRYTEVMKYPDGRAPSYGDTHPSPNTGASPGRAASTKWPALLVFEESGYAVLKDRTAGGAVPYQLAFVAPSKTSIHKHQDNLSFAFWADGVEWLIDPGFYTHQYTDRLPAYARGPSAHNAVVLPGWDYSIEPGLTRVSGHSQGTGPGQSFQIRGDHRAYPGLTVSRVIGGVYGSGRLTVHDEVTGKAPQTGLLMLHLGEMVSAEVAGSQVTLSAPSTPVQVRVQLPAGTECEAFTGVNDGATILGWSFPSFAQALPITTVRCEVPLEVPLDWSLEVLPAS